MRREDSLEKTLMLGKCEGRRRRGRQRMRWLDSVTKVTNMNLTQLRGRQEGVACCGPWGHEELDTTKQLNKQTSNYIFLFVGLGRAWETRGLAKIFFSCNSHDLSTVVIPSGPDGNYNPRVFRAVVPNIFDTMEQLGEDGVRVQGRRGTPHTDTHVRRGGGAHTGMHTHTHVQRGGGTHGAHTHLCMYVKGLCQGSVAGGPISLAQSGPGH